MEKEDSFWKKLKGLSKLVPVHIHHVLKMANPNASVRADRKLGRYAQQMRTDKTGDPIIAEDIAQMAEKRNDWVQKEAKK